MYDDVVRCQVFRKFLSGNSQLKTLSIEIWLNDRNIAAIGNLTPNLEELELFCCLSDEVSSNKIEKHFIQLSKLKKLNKFEFHLHSVPMLLAGTLLKSFANAKIPVECLYLNDLKVNKKK